MRKWVRQFQLELRLIFGNKFFVILPVLFGVWMLHHLLNVPFYKPNNLVLNAYDFHKLGHTMSLGAAMLLGMLIIRRDAGPAIHDWLGSLPVSSFMLVTAKFVAGWLYLSTFTMVMAVVFSGVAYHKRVPWPDVLDVLTHDALQYEWSYAVTLALAMFLASAITQRIAYLIGFCAWMFGTFFMDIFLISRSQLYFLKTFHLNQFTIDSMMNNEVWGWKLFSSEIWLSRLFVAAFTGMLILWIIAIGVKRRPAAGKKIWLISAAAAILLSVLAFVPYGRLWQERFAVHHSFVREGFLAEDSGEASALQNGVDVQSYDIQMEQKNRDDLHVKASLAFSTTGLPEGEPLYFTLNRLFRVEKVQLNGQEVEVERQGDTLLIRPEALDWQRKQQVLSLEYAGSFFLWGFDHHNEVMHGFVKGEHVFLPAHLAWYPLPGKQPIFERSPLPDDERLFRIIGRQRYYLQAPDTRVIASDGFYPGVSAAGFTITLRGFKGDVYTTAAAKESVRDRHNNLQHFYIEKAERVSLIGGHVTEIGTGGAYTVVSSPLYDGHVNLFLKDMEQMEAYFSQWLEKMPAVSRTIFHLPFDSIGVERYAGTIIKAMDDALIVREDTGLYSIHDERYARNRHAALALKDIIYFRLFKGLDFRGYVQSDQTIAPAISDAFYYLYLKDGLHLNNEAFMRWVEPDLEPYEHLDERSGNDAGQDPDALVRRKVVDALMQGKTAELKSILGYFYAKMASAKSETPYPVIGLKEWQEKWAQVMGNE
ncbi:MAG: hypothetical protein BAA01_09655 [Bacillus thermozeamaize]|uniref:Uncharacterized protein n=1 Tax=Bacillus thermozeamaize TaxID=230954 RepID=A0A1Y3Q3N2_9BACI|nr:MAG: hypothetical protein BAA01_09655 [Bacillus thermozeamaize]